MNPENNILFETPPCRGNAAQASSFEARPHLQAGLLAVLTFFAQTGVAAPPSNDAFSSAATLYGPQGWVAGSNRDASREPLEPPCFGELNGKSVWYQWQATCGGVLQLDPQASVTPIGVAVYRGQSLGLLDPVASGMRTAFQFPLIPGEVYHFAIEGQAGAEGEFTLRWQQTFDSRGGPDLVILTNSIQPVMLSRTFSPDDCQVLDGCTYAGRRQLIRFGVETWNQGGDDIVIGSTAESPLYEFNACKGYYQFRYYAQFRLLDAKGQSVAGGTKFGFCLEDSHRQSLTAGETPKYSCNYQGLQAGWSDLYSANLACQYVDVTAVPPGQYALEVHINPLNRLAESDRENNIALIPVVVDPPCTSPPSNDNFASAQILTGTMQSLVADTRCATKQPGEINLAGNPGGSSLWYRWTAPYSGPATVSLLGSAFDTVLGVYTSSTLAGLPSGLVAENDDFATNVFQSQITFQARAGTTYRIAADGFNGGEGADAGTLLLHLNPGRNDDFANALPLVGSRGSLLGYSEPATLEPEEPAHADQLGGHSLWFRWIAPFEGGVQVDTSNSRFDTLLAVYQGPSLRELVPLASSASPLGGRASRLSFPAQTGQTYYLAVDGREGSSGLFSLQWLMATRLTLSRQPEGKLQLAADGAPGETCALESSIDLLSWASVSIQLNVTGHVDFGLQDSTDRVRFYRVTSTPPAL